MRFALKCRVVIGAITAAILFFSGTAKTAPQRKKPEVVATIDGDPMYQVLPAGAIPAITEPEYVKGSAASGQMSESEPVIGVVIKGESIAYSSWQLDAHEIVNDTAGSIPFAVTW